VPNRTYSRQTIDYSKEHSKDGFIRYIRQNQQRLGLTDKNKMENCAAAFIICNKLFLLKENWSYWNYQKSVDPEEMK